MRKVITIKQPFASLIAAGLKEYEFRTWKTNYRGEILIHAGKSIDKVAMKKFECFRLDYPTGCIIAKAELTDCVPVTENMKGELREKNFLVYSGTTENVGWNGYGFKLENVETVEPVFVNGMLGLWEYNLADVSNNI
ncbi:MAG: ASCH domain-containing protein [Clostridia bacterium]|nr:ASCH domain-containing protein [Clostridia bacterium]